MAAAGPAGHGPRMSPRPARRGGAAGHGRAAWSRAAQLDQAGQCLVGAAARAAHVGDGCELIGNGGELAGCGRYPCKFAQQADRRRSRVVITGHHCQRGHQPGRWAPVGFGELIGGPDHLLAHPSGHRAGQAANDQAERGPGVAPRGQRDNQVSERVTVTPEELRQQFTLCHPRHRRVMQPVRPAHPRRDTGRGGDQPHAGAGGTGQDALSDARCALRVEHRQRLQDGCLNRGVGFGVPPLTQQRNQPVRCLALGQRPHRHRADLGIPVSKQRGQDSDLAGDCCPGGTGYLKPALVIAVSDPAQHPQHHNGVDAGRGDPGQERNRVRRGRIHRSLMADTAP